MPGADLYDCVVIGGGPAGLTAALYFARYRRRFVVLDTGASRARWIPASHNLPFFADGIPGPDVLRLQREHATRYGATILNAEATRIAKPNGHFAIDIRHASGAAETLSARRVLLATGAADIEPCLPNLPDAISQGLVRYCPICDGFESRDRRIAVLGTGASGLAEATFIARTYSDDVTLLTLGQGMALTPEESARAAEHRIRVIETPIAALQTEAGRITAMTTGGGEQLRFDVLYSALGLRYRTSLAKDLGAEHDERGALIVDSHYQTTIRGLYAAGAIVQGLDQIVVAMGHAAIAATAIHNRCELPIEDEE